MSVYRKREHFNFFSVLSVFFMPGLWSLSGPEEGEIGGSMKLCYPHLSSCMLFAFVEVKVGVVLGFEMCK